MTLNILSAIPRPTQVKVHRLKQQVAILGKQEHVFPCPSVMVRPAEVMTLPEQHAEHILRQVGVQGIVLVADGESKEDALRRAQEIRFKWLRGFLAHFRSTNATIKAAGGIPNMPSDALYDAMREFNALKKLFGFDALERDLAQAVPDAHAEELAAFGVPQETVPMVPGVPSELSGIADL